MAKEPSPVLEVEELLGGHGNWGKSLDKGKDGAGAGTKRKSTSNTTGPPAKQPRVEPAAPNLRELDHMAMLLNEMWDKVVWQGKLCAQLRGVFMPWKVACARWRIG